jgi:hypothetical protein
MLNVNQDLVSLAHQTVSKGLRVNLFSTTRRNDGTSLVHTSDTSRVATRGTQLLPSEAVEKLLVMDALVF